MGKSATDQEFVDSIHKACIQLMLRSPLELAKYRAEIKVLDEKIWQVLDDISEDQHIDMRERMAEEGPPDMVIEHRLDVDEEATRNQDAGTREFADAFLDRLAKYAERKCNERTDQGRDSKPQQGKETQDRG